LEDDAGTSTVGGVSKDDYANDRNGAASPITSHWDSPLSSVSGRYGGPAAASAMQVWQARQLRRV